MLYEIKKGQSDNLANTETRVFTTVWDTELSEIRDIVHTIYSDSFPTYYAPKVQIEPMTDEIKSKVDEYCDNIYKAKFDLKKQEYLDLIEDENAKRLPQNIGQRVIVKSGKHKNVKGNIFFTCDDKYNQGSKRTFMQDTILKIIADSKATVNNNIKEIVGIKNENQTFFVKTIYCEVIGNFIPYQMPTDDEIHAQLSRVSQNFKSLFKEV